MYLWKKNKQKLKETDKTTNLVVFDNLIYTYWYVLGCIATILGMVIFL